MKNLITKKVMLNSENPVLCVPYCRAQFLLKYLSPFAYSKDVYGWACDYYFVGSVVISTGSRPVGRKINLPLLNSFNELARDVSDNDKILELLDDWLTAENFDHLKFGKK